MPRFPISEQIECIELVQDEAVKDGMPGRSACLSAAIANLKRLDYQLVEERRKARRERKSAALVDAVSK